LHTNRVKGGPVGDKIAYEGERISLYLPPDMPAFRVRSGGTDKSAGAGIETLSKNIVTSEYFESLGTVEEWLYFENGFAYGATIKKLKKNFSPLPGWVLHTNRVKGGPVGDKIAYEGERISLYLPPDMPAFRVR
jgi:hypothetical protein